MYRCARRGLQEGHTERERERAKERGGGDLELLDYGGLPSDLMTDNFLSAFIMRLPLPPPESTFQLCFASSSSLSLTSLALCHFPALHKFSICLFNTF